MTRPPDFRIRYKKTLKSTGSPIIVWDTNEGVEYACSSFELKNCDVIVWLSIDFVLGGS